MAKKKRAPIRARKKRPAKAAKSSQDSRGARRPRAATPRVAPKSKGPGSGSDIPQMFRINVEVADLAAAGEFYGQLFGAESRRQAGSRCYITAGPVTLQVVDVSSVRVPQPAAKALYFTVRDLDAIHARAVALQCLALDEIHGTPAGEICVRPWGERSFYAVDPWKNPLCFVEAGTTYPG